MTPKVALFRPLDEGRRSAELIEARGFAATLAPAAEIAATGRQPGPGAYDVLIATSARAFASLAPDARERLAATTVCVVGKRTAEAAAASGLRSATAVCDDAASLAALLVKSFMSPMNVLFLAAKDRNDVLETALAQSGHRVETVEVYEARAVAAWSRPQIAALAKCQAALHYSPRSAALALALAGRSGLVGPFFAASHICISQEAARPLREAGVSALAVAASAQESALVEALVGSFAARG